MRIAVIGGGISGCCAASAIAASRTLAARCPTLEVTVFESGRGVGGRAATRRLEVRARGSGRGGSARGDDGTLTRARGAHASRAGAAWTTGASTSA